MPPTAKRAATSEGFVPGGMFARRAPGACPARYHCIKYLISSPKFILTLVSFKVFKRSPQPLKAGIVATAVSRRFMEFSMYSQRCIIAGTVAACSACDHLTLGSPPSRPH